MILFFFFFKKKIILLDGHYVKESVQNKSKSSKFCCTLPTSNPYESSNWRNQLVRETLESLDKNWKQILGYLSFYSTTLSLYDLHLEYDINKKVVDCTHFIYVPFSFSFLWNEIVEECLRLVQK